MIALNLLLVFVLDFTDTKKIEFLYYLIPMTLATSLVIYPIMKSIYFMLDFVKTWRETEAKLVSETDWFGYDNGNCFFRYDKDLKLTQEEYFDRLYVIEWYEF